MQRQEPDYFDRPSGIEKDDGASSGDGKFGATPAYPAHSNDGMTGEVYDPYGGKKLGMVRVSVTTSSNAEYEADNTFIDNLNLLH